MLPNDQFLHLVLTLKERPELTHAIEKLIIKEIPQLEKQAPLLLFTLEGMDTHKQLCLEDLRKVLGVFGGLRDIHLEQFNQVRVEYESILYAFLARQQLNCKFIKGLNLLVKMEWLVVKGNT